MSDFSSAIAETISRKIRQEVERHGPYRAIVTNVTGSGLVKIKLPGTSSTGGEAYARVVGFDLAVNDEVLVLPVRGVPVVIGQLQRAATDSGDYTLPFGGDGGGSTVIVKEGGSVVDPDIDTLDFDGTAFTISESPENEANITLAFGTGAGQPAEGNHTHTSAGVTDFNEAAQDAVGSILTDTSTIDLTYNDGSNQITAVVIDNSNTQKIEVAKAGTLIGTRKRLNLVEGSNVTLTVADNGGSDRVDVTVSATGGGSSGIAVAEGGSILDSDITTLDFSGDDFTLTESPENEVNIALAPAIYVTYQFFVYNQAASASTDGYIMFLSGSTSNSSRQYQVNPMMAGEVVGLSMMSQGGLSSGSVIAKVKVGSTVYDFNSNGCALNTSYSNRKSSFVTRGNGVSFSGSSNIGVTFVSSSLSPTTLELICWMTVRYDP